MPEETLLGPTVTATEVTPESGEEPVEAGSATQDSSEQLTKLQAELQEATRRWEEEAKARAELTAQIDEEREARVRTEADRDREIKIRQGVQRETTSKLQELAALKQQLANQTITNTELNRIGRLVNTLAKNQLSEEELDKLNSDIKSEAERQELEQLRRDAQARTQGPSQEVPTLTPEWKDQLYRDYFSQFTVNPQDLTNEEWHQTDSSGQIDWYNKVRTEFEKRHNAYLAAKKVTVAPASQMSDEVARQFAELRAARDEDAKKLTETTVKMEAQQKELDETKRLAEEQLNRSRGMDRGHESVPEAVIDATSSKKALAKTPPTSWLYGTPEQKKAYRASMDDKNLRRQILGA